MKKITKPMSYQIHGFMIGTLGLRNSLLSVYAAIYSFTNGDYGMYYGSRAYLA